MRSKVPAIQLRSPVSALPVITVATSITHVWQRQEDLCEECPTDRRRWQGLSRISVPLLAALYRLVAADYPSVQMMTEIQMLRERVASGAVPAWRPFAPVFWSVHGTRLTRAYVRRLLPSIARKAGIAKHVHAHACGTPTPRNCGARGSTSTSSPSSSARDLVLTPR